jgi:hypothetical protein
MKRKYQFVWMILAFALVAAGTVGLARESSDPGSNSVIYQQLDRFGDVLEGRQNLFVTKRELLRA